jgi:two-component system cell cycle response regulator
MTARIPVEGVARIVFVGSAAVGAAAAAMLAPLTVERLPADTAAAGVREGSVTLLLLELTGDRDMLRESLSALQEEAARRPLPVLALVARDDPDRVVEAFEGGVADVGGLPLVEGELVARVRLMLRRANTSGHLRARVRSARLRAMTDPVTKLYNRVYFDAEVARAIAVARQSNRPLTLLMVDIDSLKPINDSFGHAAGDRVLAGVAAQLIVSLRSNDIVARFGGDEIAVAMPDTDVDIAAHVARRLCAEIAELPIVSVNVTVSIGVAGLSDADADAAALLARADSALYAGKRAGRNRVEIAT